MNRSPTLTKTLVHENKYISDGFLNVTNQTKKKTDCSEMLGFKDIFMIVEVKTRQWRKQKNR